MKSHEISLRVIHLYARQIPGEGQAMKILPKFAKIAPIIYRAGKLSVSNPAYL